MAKATRYYHVIAVNEKSGRKTYMTSSPVTHAEGVTIMSKLSHHPARRIQLEELTHNPAEIHVDINSHNAPGRARNPAKRGAPRKGTASPRRKSQITGKKPTVRLVRRRQANVKEGYFPNPAPTMDAPYWIYQNVELFQGRELRETKSFVAACQQKVVADQIVKLLQQYADEGVTFTVEKAY